MKTNKKVWATSLCAILLGITVYSGYHTYNKYQEINESLLTLRDVEAMAGGETGGANGKQYHKDNPLPCTITEYFNCHIGITDVGKTDNRNHEKNLICHSRPLHGLIRLPPEE